MWMTMEGINVTLMYTEVATVTPMLLFVTHVHHSYTDIYALSHIPLFLSHTPSSLLTQTMILPPTGYHTHPQSKYLMHTFSHTLSFSLTHLFCSVSHTAHYHNTSRLFTLTLIHYYCTIHSCIRYHLLLNNIFSHARFQTHHLQFIFACN